MKKYLFIILNCICFNLYSQDISSINSGATSNDNLIYSVGEIFVLPTSNPDEANSGIIGAVSISGFFITGVEDIENPNKVLVYPNPTANSIFIETGNQTVNKIFIYDTGGRLISTRNMEARQIDVSDLQIGVYIIKTDNSNIQPFSIIKK